MTTAKTIIKRALRELGVIPNGGEPTPGEYTDALEGLNDIIETWQTDQRAFWSENDEQYTLTANNGQYAVGNAVLEVASITRVLTAATITTRKKHSFETGNKATIAGCVQTDYNITGTVTVTGPYTFVMIVANSPATPATTATTITVTNAGFNTIARPVDLLGAFFRAAGTDTPLGLMTEKYWNAIAAKTTAAAAPSKILYRPGMPFGQILLYPVPTVAGVLHAKVRSTLGAFTGVNHDQYMPPGYARGLGLALSIDQAPSFGERVSPETLLNITSAFKTLWELNTGESNTQQAPKTVVIQQAAPPAIGGGQ